MKLDDFRAITIPLRAFLPSFYFCELARLWLNKLLRRAKVFSGLAMSWLPNGKCCGQTEKLCRHKSIVLKTKQQLLQRRQDLEEKMRRREEAPESSTIPLSLVDSFCYRSLGFLFCAASLGIYSFALAGGVFYRMNKEFLKQRYIEQRKAQKEYLNSLRRKSLWRRILAVLHSRKNAKLI